MLRALHVQNFILIDNLTLDLGSGFHVLSGETGAGKSLLVDALSMLSGARAQKDWVRHGAKEAVVEAVFDLADAPKARAELEALGVIVEDELVVRRTVGAEGRGRVIIGGQLGSVGELQRVTRALFSICGQNAHYELAAPDAALAALDRYAQCEPVRDKFGEAFTRFSEVGRAIEELKATETQRLQRLDFIDFQVSELREAAPQAGEDARLRAERARLGHAEKLAGGLAQVVERLTGDAAAAEQVGVARQKMRELTKLDPALQPLCDRLEGVYVELSDLARSVDQEAEREPLSPGQLDEIESRLALLQRLSRKHGVSADELSARLQSLACERALLVGSDEARAGLEAEREELTAKLVKIGERLTKTRETAAKQMGTEVMQRLRPLAMPKAEFFVALTRAESVADAGPLGMDRAAFELMSNRGEPRRNLGKIASGGELSRVSLALEATLGRRADAPTYIFDEVDAGIGGAVAEVVGQTLAQLGQEKQVLCVTHLAQIAALGTQQYLVAKSTRGDRTTSSIAVLDGTERREELARMMGGVEITDAVRRHAAELLDRAAAH